MSAFICDYKTFSNIYSGLKLYGESKLNQFSELRRPVEKALGGRAADEAINILYYLNIRAVNQRYGEAVPEAATKTELMKMCRFDPGISIYRFLKSLECLQYQMTEGDVPQTATYKLLDDLIAAVCRTIAHMSAEYADAQWG